LSKKKFLKSLESIRRQIEIHHQKILNEQDKLVPDTNLINHWYKEIVGLNKSLIRAEKRLRRGS
jgi:hypothetical protein